MVSQQTAQEPYHGLVPWTLGSRPGSIPGSEWAPWAVVGHSGHIVFTGFYHGHSVGRLWWEAVRRLRRPLRGRLFIGVYRLGATEWVCLWDDDAWGQANASE